MIGPVQAGPWIRPKLRIKRRSLVPCVWHGSLLQGQEGLPGMRGLCRVATRCGKILPNQ
jgi:hypothetical protein